MCVCIYKHTHVYVRTCVRAYVRVFVCVCIYMWIDIDICVCVCVHMHMYIYRYIDIFVSIYVHIYIYTIYYMCTYILYTCTYTLHAAYIWRAGGVVSIKWSRFYLSCRDSICVGVRRCGLDPGILFVLSGFYLWSLCAPLWTRPGNFYSWSCRDSICRVVVRPSGL